MRSKIKEKKRAQALRRQGLSYSEILEKVHVSKSSISVWCRDIKLTKTQKHRLLQKTERNRKKFGQLGPKILSAKRQKEISKIKTSAKKEIHPLTPYEFKIAGAMLYWAEGSKNNGVEITNSDPTLIKFMLLWLKKACAVSHDQLKARLNIHANQNDEKIKQYWSKITKIPLSQFTKSYIKPEGRGHRKNILKYGVIKIKFNNENLRHRIQTWIQVLSKQT